MPTLDPTWPPLPLDAWAETRATLHLWTQIVGKIRMSRAPWVAHAWHVPLYVDAHGLTTSLVPCGDRGFEIGFDLCDHRLRIATTDGERRSFALRPMSVAAFYRRTFRALEELAIDAPIRPWPVEIADPITRFPDDAAVRSYDPDAARRFWRVLVHANRVLTAFRARFAGKASPVHFFWGGFDLAATRFSGRPAPPHPGGAPNCPAWVMRDAYSHEVSSAGFWPGNGLGEAAFYAYAWPEPDGFADFPVRPAAARYHAGLGEFVLPYEAVRTADDPDAALLAFLQSTYEAAAELGRWDRAALEAVDPRRFR